jgi:hypothetical protein
VTESLLLEMFEALSSFSEFDEISFGLETFLQGTDH